MKTLGKMTDSSNGGCVAFNFEFDFRAIGDNFEGSICASVHGQAVKRKRGEDRTIHESTERGLRKYFPEWTLEDFQSVLVDGKKLRDVIEEERAKMTNGQKRLSCCAWRSLATQFSRARRVLGDLVRDIKKADQDAGRPTVPPPAGFMKLVEMATKPGSDKKALKAFCVFVELMERLPDSVLASTMYAIEDRASNIGRKHLTTIRWAMLNYSMRTGHRYAPVDAALPYRTKKE